MAEAADHPADKAVTASMPQAAPPAAKDEAPAVYGSVSIVAVIGFVLAVLYTATVGVGAVVALFNHTPWILPIWMFALPVVAAAVCFAARAEIRKSEGTVTGARLTAWGVGLSAVVGLLYAAYYAATYLAVTSQATDFMNQWIDHIKKDQIDQAFLYTQPPPRPRPDDAALRDRLEMEFDRSPGGHGGLLTSFRGSELVRQFEEGGGDAQIQFLGVQGWNYDKSSYMVDLSYRITTAGITTDLLVTAVGVDDENGDRQWFAKDPHAVKDHVFSNEGLRMQVLAGQGREFGQEWLDKLVAGRWDEAYLETLSPAERERQRQERGPAFDEGRKAFMAGSVVHYDPANFWVGPKQSDKARQENQAKIADMVRSLFGKARSDLPAMSVARSLPTYTHDGATTRVGIDMDISPNNLVVQARLVLTTEIGQEEPVKEHWRVESLDLLTAKTAANPVGALPGSPGGPQVMPPGGR